MRDLRDLPRLVERPRKKKATLVEFGEVKRLPSDRPVLLDLHQHVGCAQWRRPCGPCIGDQSYRGPDAFNQVPRVCALGLLLPFFCCRRRRGCFCRPSTTLLTFVPYHCVRLVCCCRRHGTACNIAAFSLQHPTGYLERQREDLNHGGSEPDLGPFSSSFITTKSLHLHRLDPSPVSAYGPIGLFDARDNLLSQWGKG